MTFIFIVILWQVAAHYLDWRRFVRGDIPQPIFLVVNYVIGSLGVLIPFELWTSISVDPESAAWILSPDIDPRWKLPFILIAGGAAVTICYLADLLNNRNQSHEENSEQMRLKDQRIAELEQEFWRERQATGFKAAKAGRCRATVAARV